MSNVLDGNALFRDLMALNAAHAEIYRNFTPPTRPDVEAIPGREDLAPIACHACGARDAEPHWDDCASDELVDGGAVGAVSQEREE